MAIRDIKISTPTSRDVVPSTKTPVTLRPFRVGDEKVLMLAGETKDPKEMSNALKEVINNCVEGVKVDDLASFDIEYLFLKLRSLSVGESSDINITCKGCKAKNPLTVNLGDVKVAFTEGHKNTFKLSDNLAVEMKYPQVDDVTAVKQNDLDSIIRLVASSVKTLFYGEETYEVTVADIPDVIDLLQQLDTKQFTEIQEFFNTLPKLKETVRFKCVECEEENEHDIEGLANFF